MSKIAEQRALETYPINRLYNEQCMMNEDVNLQYRIGYEEGFDQAFPYLMEKAEKFLERQKRLSNIFFDEDFIPFFKEQMMED